MNATRRRPAPAPADSACRRLRLPQCISSSRAFRRASTRPTRRGRTVPDYLKAIRQRLGLSRCVVIQSVTHGTDNSNLVLRWRPLRAARGACSVIALDTSDKELRRRTRGVRGIRFRDGPRRAAMGGAGGDRRQDRAAWLAHRPPDRRPRPAAARRPAAGIALSHRVDHSASSSTP